MSGPSARPHPARRVLRRALQALALLGAGLGGLSVGGLYWLTTASGNAFLREQVERQVRGQLVEGHFTLGGLHTNLVDGISLRQVDLVDGDGNSLVSADRILVDWDLRAVLHRRVRILQVRLDQPEVDLRSGPTGQLAILDLFGVQPDPNPEPTTPWQGLGARVDLPRVEVRGGRLAWQGGAVDGLDLDAGLWVEGRVVTLDRLSASADLLGAVEGRLGLDASGVLDHGDLRVDQLRASLDGLELALEGRIATVETAPQLDLELRAPLLPAAELARLTGVEGLPGVDLSLAADVQGPLGALRAEVDLGAGAGGHLRGTLGADLLADRLGWRAQLTGVALDAAAIAPGRLPEGARATGVDLWVAGSGTAWPDALSVAVQLQVQDLDAGGERFPRVAALAVLGGGEVAVLDLDVVHAAGTVGGRGRVEIEGQRLVLDLDAELPRLAALSRLAGQPLAGSARWRPEVRVDWSDELGVQGTGPLSLGEVAVAGVSVAGADGPLRLEYGGGVLDLGGALAISGLGGDAYRVEGGTADWTLRWSEALGTQVGADVAVQGLSTPLAAARAKGASGRVDVSVPPRGEVSVDADLVVKELRVTPGADPATGPLALELSGDRLHAEVDLTRVGGDPLLVATVDGALAEQATWTIGRLELGPTPQVRLVADGDVVIELVPEGLRSARASLSGPVGSIAVSTDEESGTLRLSGSGLDLAALSGLASLAAGAEAAGEARQEPPPSEEPAQAGDTVAQQASSDTAAALDQAGAPLAGAPLVGQARLDLVVERGQDLALEAVRGSVDVAGLWVPGVVGSVDAHLGIDGTLDRPALALDVDAGHGRLLSLRGQVPLDVAALDLDCAGPLALEVALLPTRLGQLRGVLPALQGAEAPLHELPGEHTRLSSHLVATGSACDPTLELYATVESPLGREGELVRIDLEMGRDGDALRTEAWLEQAFQRRLQVRGTASTSLGEVIARARAGQELGDALVERLVGDFNVAVVPLAVPVESLGSFVALPSGVSGRLAGGLTLTGSPGAPRVSGALMLTEGRLGAVGVQSGLLTVSPEAVGYAAEVRLGFAPLEGEAEQAAPPQRSLLVRARLPMTPGMPMDEVRAAEGFEVLAEGDVPLAVVEGVLPGLSEGEGVARLSALVGGTLDAPEVDATLSLSEGALTYAPFGLRYEGIGFQLQATDQRVVLRDLVVRNRKRWAATRLAGGAPRTLRGSASIDLEKFRPTMVRAGAELDGFWITAQEGRTLALNGALLAEGTWPSLGVSGDLQVAEALMRFGPEFFGGGSSLAIDPAISIVRSGETALVRGAEPAPPLWQSFDLALNVDLLRNLRLSAEVPLNTDYGEQFAQLSTVGLDADLAGELVLSQQRGRMTLQGEVETVRGTARLLGGDFDVAGGTITFLGDGYDNPLVDITAVRSTNYGDVDARVSGLVSDLEYGFSSEEYPDQLDIVALLLFGVPASDRGDEGQSGQELIAAALASFGAGQVEQLVGTSIVDQIEIDPTSSIRLGKALSDKLFLRFEQSWTTDDDQGNRTEITLEYLITRRLYAEFVTGDRGASSATLYWRWRF